MTLQQNLSDVVEHLIAPFKKQGDPQTLLHELATTSIAWHQKNRALNQLVDKTLREKRLYEVEQLEKRMRRLITEYEQVRALTARSH